MDNLRQLMTWFVYDVGTNWEKSYSVMKAFIQIVTKLTIAMNKKNYNSSSEIVFAEFGALSFGEGCAQSFWFLA